MNPFLPGALLSLAAFCASAATAPAPSPASAPALAHGLFSELHVYKPAAAPHRFAMLVTEGTAPSARESAMLHAMLAADAMVATIPLPPFYARLAAQDGKCTYAPGAFENLSRYLQAFEQVPGYLPPVIVGADKMASYVQSVVAQAPAGIFAAGLAAGLEPLVLTPPPCAPKARAASGADASPATPWVAVPDSDGAAFEHAFAQLAMPPTAIGAPPAQLDGLPIIEVPVSQPGKRFAVLLSGDGGWAGIDKSLGTALAAQGVPVAGFDSLRYFWGPRTPEELAADLDRVIRYYAAHWARSEVLLVGYSQGADVLPFAINRLPAATRANVRLTALLGPGQKASFEFHLTNWIGPSGDRPIAPEALKLPAASTLCVYGVQEKDSLCPELAPAHARAMPLTGGHHFGGDYAALATMILEAVPR